jgi:hypothetical protein
MNVVNEMRRTNAHASHGKPVAYDLKALAVAVGILTVVLVLCRLAAIWPGAI